MGRLHGRALRAERERVLVGAQLVRARRVLRHVRRVRVRVPAGLRGRALRRRVGVRVGPVRRGRRLRRGGGRRGLPLRVRARVRAALLRARARARPAPRLLPGHRVPAQLTL